MTDPMAEHDELLRLVEALDHDGRLAKASLRRAYHDAQYQAIRKLLPLDPVAVAEVLDEPSRAQALEFARELEGWAVKFQRALQPLRIVKEGHR